MITSPTEIVATVETTPSSCTGVADGTITLTPSGGSGGDYGYDWGASGLEGAAPTGVLAGDYTCLLYTSPSPRDLSTSRMPSSA